MKAIIIGNGPSLTPELLESLGENTWACNRIWKMFDKTSWRPKNYVRAELPSYNEQDVLNDLHEMGKVGCRLWLHRGFWGMNEPKKPHPDTGFEYFYTCKGIEEHDWHLPLICGYGTVVHIAAQLAVQQGADEIEFVGCDLGTKHFYPEEVFINEKLAKRANKILKGNVKATWRKRNIS